MNIHQFNVLFHLRDKDGDRNPRKQDARRSLYQFLFLCYSVTTRITSACEPFLRFINSFQHKSHEMVSINQTLKSAQLYWTVLQCFHSCSKMPSSGYSQRNKWQHCVLTTTHHFTHLKRSSNTVTRSLPHSFRLLKWEKEGKNSYFIEKHKRRREDTRSTDTQFTFSTLFDCDLPSWFW